MHLYFDINCLLVTELVIEIYFDIFYFKLSYRIRDQSLFLIFYFKINYSIATEIATEHALIYLTFKINYSIAIEYHWFVFYI